MAKGGLKKGDFPPKKALLFWKKGPEKIPAGSYSLTQLPMQYHRRWRALLLHLTIEYT
jgi:hypothetical protein